jgi:hypothetical protein
MKHLVVDDTHPEKLPQRRVVRLARLALDIFQILCEPKSEHFEHPPKVAI